MYCRLLDDLETQARTAPDRVSWARAACKIAVHRARQGQLDEAQALIQRVRDTFGVELHHEIAPWVMLAEGVIHYFRLDMRMSWERLRRAYALAVALRLESARSTSAAWMAMLSFNTSRFQDMSKFLLEVLTESDVNDHHARGRASLVLADAFHTADRYDLARKWYDKARLHAAAEGDQAQISAMLFNVAVFRTANVRIANAFGIRQEWEELRAKMEAGSSMTYDAAVGATSCEGAMPLMRGHLMAVEGKYAEALGLLQSIREDSLRKAEPPLLFADIAFCLANLGHFEAATKAAKSCESVLADLPHPDDLAFTYSRLAAVARIMGDEANAARLFNLAKAQLVEHREYQSDMLTRLTELLTSLNSHSK